MKNMFRFVKLGMRANDPTRRYRIQRGEERETVGDLAIRGDGAAGEVALVVTCLPNLLGEKRELCLATAVRFVEEIVGAEGYEMEAVPAEREWLPGEAESAWVRVEFRAAGSAP